MMSVSLTISPRREIGAYVCPMCRRAVEWRDASYVCPVCGRDYPVLLGIPDFRLQSDQYLTLEEERAKAIRLHAFSETHCFVETLAEYYRITEDVPPEMAKRFADYVLAGEMRGRAILGSLPLDDSVEHRLLDAGCGSGGMVMAAARLGYAVTGADIALRWLVIAQKRLEEAGLEGELVCADIAHPPFPDGAFDRVYASDLFEHLPDDDEAARALHALLEPGGRIYITGSNRFTLAVYPPAGLWGVGFLPRVVRHRYVVWRRGIDTLRFLKMQSPAWLVGVLTRVGFDDIRLAPMTVPADRGQSFACPKRIALSLYRLLLNMPLTRGMLLRLGPVFEIAAQRSDCAPSSRKTIR